MKELGLFITTAAFVCFILLGIPGIPDYISFQPPPAQYSQGSEYIFTLSLSLKGETESSEIVKLASCKVTAALLDGSDKNFIIECTGDINTELVLLKSLFLEFSSSYQKRLLQNMKLQQDIRTEKCFKKDFIKYFNITDCQ